MKYFNKICDLESRTKTDLEQIRKAIKFFGGCPDFIYVDQYGCVDLNYVDNDPKYGDCVNQFTWGPDDSIMMWAEYTRLPNERYEPSR